MIVLLKTPHILANALKLRYKLLFKIYQAIQDLAPILLSSLRKQHALALQFQRIFGFLLLA